VAAGAHRRRRPDPLPEPIPGGPCRSGHATLGRRAASYAIRRHGVRANRPRCFRGRGRRRLRPAPRRTRTGSLAGQQGLACRTSMELWRRASPGRRPACAVATRARRQWRVDAGQLCRVRTVVAVARDRFVAYQQPGWPGDQREPVAAFGAEVRVRLRARPVRQRWWRFSRRDHRVLKKVAARNPAQRGDSFVAPPAPAVREVSPAHVRDPQAGSYATNVTYHPNGTIAGFTYGNGIVHT